MLTTTYKGDNHATTSHRLIGVKDLARSKKFYADGLGAAIDKDYPNFVAFNLGEGWRAPG